MLFSYQFLVDVVKYLQFFENPMRWMVWKLLESIYEVTFKLPSTSGFEKIVKVPIWPHQLRIDKKTTDQEDGRFKEIDLPYW